MKNAYFLTLMIPLFVFSCGVNESDDSKSTLESTVYKIDLSAEKVDFLSQVESISIFGFEETEASLLKPSSTIFSTESGYVFIQEQEGTVYVFDQNGSFVSNFNRKGGGPEEYGQMWNTVYRDGFIETHDKPRQRLVRYDLDGSYLGEVKLPHRAIHLIHQDERYVLSMGSNIGEDSVGYNIITLNERGEEVAKHLPFYLPLPLAITTTINELQSTEAGLLYNAIFTDSLIHVGKNNTTSFAKFDFGESWLWTEEVYANGSNAMRTISQLKEDDGKVWNYNWVLGKNRVEILYNLSFRESRRGFVDRTTGRFYHYKFNAWGEERPNIRFLRFEGDELLLMMTPDVLDVFTSELEEVRYKVEGGIPLDRLMESENPVLVWIKFK